MVLLTSCVRTYYLRLQEDKRFFYVTKTGVPLKFSRIWVNATSPHKRKSLKPVLMGDVYTTKKVDGNRSELEISYDCMPKAKGTSFLWISMEVNAIDSMAACGVPQKQVFTFLWSKFCPHALKPKKGFDIGTYPGGSDVVRDGVATRQFTPTYITQDDYSSYVVPAGTKSLDMYITMRNGMQKFGDPKLEGWSEVRMDPDVSGRAAMGGVADSESQKFTMTFKCRHDHKPSAKCVWS